MISEHFFVRPSHEKCIEMTLMHVATRSGLALLLMLLAGCASNPGRSDAQSNAPIANQIANTSTQELRDPDYSHVIYRGGRDPRTGLATLRNY